MIDNIFVCDVVNNFMSQLDNEILNYERPLSTIFKPKEELNDFRSMKKRLGKVATKLRNKKPFDPNDIVISEREKQLILKFVNNTIVVQNFNFYYEGMVFFSGDWNKQIFSY